MGTTYAVYVGPVVRCKIERVPGEKTGCVKQGCERYQKNHYSGNENFCGACGSPKAKYKEPDERYWQEKVNEFQLFEHGAMTSYLSPIDEKFRLFVPNERRGRDGGFSVEPSCDSIHRTFKGDEIVQERTWLENAFSGEIEILRKAYGAENVSVEWCLVSTAY